MAQGAVQVTVLEVVAVLPHASVAVNNLVCEAEHDEVVIAPSLDVIVTAPHTSVAVALPNAAVIAEAVGLQPSVALV